MRTFRFKFARAALRGTAAAGILFSCLAPPALLMSFSSIRIPGHLRSHDVERYHVDQWRLRYASWSQRWYLHLGRPRQSQSERRRYAYHDGRKPGHFGCCQQRQHRRGRVASRSPPARLAVVPVRARAARAAAGGWWRRRRRWRLDDRGCRRFKFIHLEYRPNRQWRCGWRGRRCAGRRWCGGHVCFARRPADTPVARELRLRLAVVAAVDQAPRFCRAVSLAVWVAPAWLVTVAPWVARARLATTVALVGWLQLGRCGQRWQWHRRRRRWRGGAGGTAGQAARSPGAT